MNISRWIETLDAASDWRAQCRECDELLRRGQRETLVEIARACANLNPKGGQSARSSILERIIESLALSTHRDNVWALALIFEGLPTQETHPQPRTSGARRARFLASLMAQEQMPRDCFELSDWAGDDVARRELIACLVGEFVVRKREIEPHLNSQTRAIMEEHPLGHLPLRLLESEANFPFLLPRYNVGSTGRGHASPCAAGETGVGQTRELQASEFDFAAMESAVRNWREESNGRTQGGVWRWECPLDAADFGTQLLGASGLEATAGLLGARRVPFESALDVLWSAANAGGAYNSGEWGAWGRWQTWRSVGELAGAPEPNSIEETDEAAQKCVWLDFAGQSSWFDNVAWDVGLACLRPDGQSMALLAATDTD